MTCTCRSMAELSECECAGAPVLEVVVDGEPVGKERPRFARTAGYRVQTFTAGRTAAWESRAALLARVAAHAAGWRPDPTATYGAEVRAYRKHRHLGPDLDNVVKAALDAMKGAAWTDDARVREIRASVVQDAKPRVVVRVWRLQ